MPHVALKRMKIAPDVWVEHGEEIDISSWKYRTIVSYERQGLIREVPEIEPTKPKARAKSSTKS